MLHRELFLGFISIFLAINVSGQLSLDPCIENTAFKVVVIGSSTAAGAGVSVPDSAWVNRYRDALQLINPDNEVINLAVGGYTTYRLMPTNFTSPTNRPPVDTMRNITAAIKLNPDVIILNLPSNDRQWPMNEQLSNFDTISTYSWNAGVPIYICTTQPVAGINWAAYQWAVHDSVIARFAPYYLEFFTPLADSNNVLDTSLTPDGTHPNDKGHRLLFQQVWNKDILAQIYSVPGYMDLKIKSIVEPGLFNHCNDSMFQLGWEIVNIGDSLSSGLIAYSITSLNGISDSVPMYITNGLGSCVVDTIWTSNNMYDTGTYRITGRIILPSDSNTLNNTMVSSYRIVETPRLLISNDTVCRGDSGTFQVQQIAGDTVLWYAHFSDSLPIASPPVLVYNLQRDSTLYVQGVSGGLKFSGMLETNSIANISYNGNMFNLVAKEQIQIHSFRIRISSLGLNPYKIFTKSGMYQGYEQISSAWSLLADDSVYVGNAEDFVELTMPAISMNPGDTLGVYIQMQGWNYKLRYASVSQPLSYKGKHLEYYSGSGIGYNFGSIYPNRVINLKVQYEYGFNPLGACSTPKLPVQIVISKEQLDLGPDTTLFAGDTVFASVGFTDHIWVDLNSGDTISTQSYAIIDSTMGNQIQIACYAVDKWGCARSDTIACTLLSLEDNPDYLSGIKIFPNPTYSMLYIESSENIGLIEIYNSSLQLVKSDFSASQKASINLSGLPKGVYFMGVVMEGGMRFFKLVRL